MKQYPIPGFFDPNNAVKIYPIPYGTIAEEGLKFAKSDKIAPASSDKKKIGLMIIDAQNTFCNPQGELFVTGAPDDNIRLAKFIYQNIGTITHTFVTMDTHYMKQIFHPFFWNDAHGDPVQPYTMITLQDLKDGKYSVNPAMVGNIPNSTLPGLMKFAHHYVSELEKKGKFALIVWPYHAMLGGVGHALTSVIEEAIRYHGFTRKTDVEFEIKGGNPFTENYSVLSPEVLTTPSGAAIASRNTKFIERLLGLDVLIIAGQAKSHCVAWSIQDLLDDIAVKDPALAQKVYLLEDATSPVITPYMDFTKDANDAFDRFRAAGMHIVKTTDPIDTWPDITNKIS